MVSSTDRQMHKEKHWTENDELRKRGKQIRDLSELEVLALTNRNQMRSILASNNEEFGELTSIKREQMITKELVERAIQLNASANLGFNEQIIKSFGEGKNVSLSGTQQTAQRPGISLSEDSDKPSQNLPGSPDGIRIHHHGNGLPAYPGRLSSGQKAPASMSNSARKNPPLSRRIFFCIG